MVTVSELTIAMLFYKETLYQRSMNGTKNNRVFPESYKVGNKSLRSEEQNKTSGIHGGYRLVSTYNLPDSKPFGGGGISE